MVLDLVIDSEAPSIDRDHNDFLQYQHRVEPDSDRDDNWSLSDDDSWFERVMHPTSPVMRFAHTAWHLKTKCAAVLTQAGVLKPKLKLHERTGKCEACGGMQGFLSSFAEVELGAAAGCPSCTILMKGVRKYCPNKRALWKSGVNVMDSWNSGCAGRQFIRTKNVAATLHGAMGVIVGLEGHLDVKHIVSGPEGYVNRLQSGLPGPKNKSTKQNEDPSNKVVELNFFGTKGINACPKLSLLVLLSIAFSDLACSR
jgi:hypothetical protein